MPDVTIRRCVLRVVRRGGWSWGPDPRRVATDAVRALPALLAAELECLLPETAAGEIAAPLRVDVRLSLAEFGAWARGVAGVPNPSAGDAVGPPGRAPPLLKEGLADRLRRGLAGMRLAERVAPVALPGIDAGSPALQADPQARAAAVLALLVSWRTASRLEMLLGRLPDPVVQAWHRVLLESAIGGGAATPPPPMAADLLAPLAARAATASSEERVRLRLLAVAELAVAAALPVTDGTSRVAINAILPPTPGEPSARRRAEPVAPRAPAILRLVTGTEVKVASALPFLLLGPLHRTGWLDVMEATLAGAGLETRLPALAVALALKVLAEPERGWRRPPATLAAAGAFAGDAETRAGEDLAALAGLAAPLVPALDAVVRRSLLDGRRAGAPLLLCAVDAGHLLVDPDGAFLITYAADRDTLIARTLEASAPLFVPADDADREVLAALDASGLAFVTSAVPVRGERWHPVSGTRAPRLFTNRGADAFVVPRNDVAERARDTWAAFDRRGIPGRPEDPALDRSLALAAALALGTLAWELWRQRETTDPLLALERFGDLEGTVRFDDRRVRVRLPLGKRFRDLEAAGLLRDVPRVSWLGFRSVVFAGG